MEEAIRKRELEGEQWKYALAQAEARISELEKQRDVARDLFRASSKMEVRLADEVKTLREALERLGEAFHDLSDDPDHRGSFFIRKPGHSPGIPECENYHCRSAREALSTTPNQAEQPRKDAHVVAGGLDFGLGVQGKEKKE